jgi:ATP-dependent Lhr-like helicase
MEETGKLRRGYFVEGLGGIQFALPGAVDRLRALRDLPPSRTGVVLAATDPANPYGAALPWPACEGRPSRSAGAYVVLVDGRASLFIERGARSVVSLRESDGTWEERAVDAMVRLVSDGRIRRLSLQRVDDSLVPLLREVGFVTTPKGLVRYA